MLQCAALPVLLEYRTTSGFVGKILQKYNNAWLKYKVTVTYAKRSHYNLRGDAIPTLPEVNITKYGLKLIRYQGAKPWNALPNGYRKISNFKLFKKSILKVYLASRCTYMFYDLSLFNYLYICIFIVYRF